MNATDFTLGILCFLILTLGSIYAYQVNHEIQTSDGVIFIDKQTTKPLYIKVNVVGAVKKPGIVAIDKNNARVINAIKATGGLHEYANITAINLAENIQNANIVSIPFNFEKEVIIIKNEKPKKKKIKKIKKQNNKKKSKKKKSIKFLSLKLKSINPNTASKSQLVLLPGIGEKISERIIKYRNTSKFKNPQDLKKVRGIGKKKVAKIAPYLTF